MAVFPSFKLTKKGEELLNRCIGEGKVLTFTKIKIGNGVPVQDWRELTDIQSSFKEFPVLETSVQKDQVLRIKAYFDNKGFLEDKKFKEIGVFVKLEGLEGEFLYSYTNAGDTGDIIPSENRGFFSRTLDIANYIGYATNITFNIESVRNDYDFNTEAEVKVATFLKAGDRIRLWGRLVQGDIQVRHGIVTSSSTSLTIDNGLFVQLTGEIIVNTIEDLKNLKGAIEGAVVEVLGYYEKGDGAGHKRIIAQADDGSGVQLVNGLWANIIHNSKVDVSWFGARGNGIISGIELLGEDDSAFLNKAIIFCKNTSATLVGDKNYRLDEQIIIYCDFYFPNSTFYTNVNLQKHAIILDSKGNNFTIDKVIASGNSHLTSKNWDKENYAIGIGFSAGNFYNKNVSINEIFYHNRGLDISPSKGNFVGYNRFKILSIIDCGWGININPVTSEDWVNQNEFYVNRIRQNSSSAGNKATRIRVVKEDGLISTPNENMFINTCLEGSHGVVIYSKNSSSKFLNIRLEAVPEKSMIFDNEISNYVASNSIIGALEFNINKLDLRRNALMPYIVSDFNIYMKQMLEVSTPITSSPIAVFKNSDKKDFLKIYGDKIYLCDQLSGIEKIVFRGNLGGNAFIDFTNGSIIRRYSEIETRLEKFNLYNSYINSGYNAPQTTKNGELFLDLKGKLKVFNGEWKEIVLSNPIQTLNTPYHVEKMKSEGVYNDFITYMDEKTAYDNQQRKQSDIVDGVANLNVIEEPVPSEALLAFKEKYLG